MSRFVSVAGERVAELAERCADDGRFSRGRTLFRKGSVSDLAIVEGSVLASVLGSGGHEYETTVSTALASPGVMRQVAQSFDPANPLGIDELIGDGIEICPGEIDLAFACDCPDWDEACKHVVAVMLAFADRVDLDETELLRWRGVDLSNTGSSAEAARPAPASEQKARTAKLSELQTLLGDTAMRARASNDTASGDPASQDRSTSVIEPALAEFLGIDMMLEPIDVSNIAAPAPLFPDAQLGPLADLGPELANALAIISQRLDPS